MTTYLITGGGRGIGLELARQLSQQQGVSKVFTTSRSPEPSEALAAAIRDAAGKILYVPCDVTSPDQARKAAQTVASQLGDKGLDILINNVGAQPITPAGIASMDSAELGTTFTANVVSAQVTTVAFLDLLRKGKAKKVINISTTVGSISLAEGFAPLPTPAYKITKAAMNMLTVQWSLEYGKDGFTIVAISPGVGTAAGDSVPETNDVQWLKTELGGEIADLEVDVGVKACIDLIEKTGPTDNGKFLNIYVPGYEDRPGNRNQYDGKNVPW